MLYRLLRAYFRLALRVFYRSIEVEGREHVPDAGPVLFTPNHPNGLLDPMFIALALDRPIWLTAKSTLASNPLLAALMRAGNVIAFHRVQDVGQGADPRANLAALDAVADRLRAGGAVVIFPEGQTHSDPGLRPFKRGVARLAYDYVADGNDGGLEIVPVGLWFEDKNAFRTRAWLRFGPPIDAGAWRAARPAAPAQALTADLQAAVDAAAVTFADRREALLLGWAAEIAETGGRAPARIGREAPGLGDRARLVERLRRGFRLLAVAGGAELEPFVDEVADYRRRLRRLGIAPAEVYLPVDAPRAARFVVREVAIALAGLVPALWGIAAHAVPVAAIAGIAAALARRNRELPTSVVFTALVVMPCWYAALAVGLGLALPWPLALGLWLAAPPCGLIALAWLGRVAAAIRRATTFVRFVRRPALQAELAARGRSILDRMRALEAELAEHAAAVEVPG